MRTLQEIFKFHHIPSKATFTEFVDYCDLSSYLIYRLLRKDEVFEDLIKNNAVSDSEFMHMINKIRNLSELKRLCQSKVLLRHLLKNFLFDETIVDKYTKLVVEGKDSLRISEQTEDLQIEDVFDLMKHQIVCEKLQNKEKDEINQELLELIEMNKVFYKLRNFKFDKSQKLKVAEILKDNEIAQNRLIQIINNNLESNYDFDSLMDCLKKQEKKSILNI